MDQNNHHCDIAIIGAGLVGATMAAAIAAAPENKDLSIILVDQGQAPTVIDVNIEPPQFDRRVVALTHASISLLSKLNIWPEVVKKRVCFYQEMRVWDDDGTAEICFDTKDLPQDSLGAIVENNLLLNSVLDRLKQFSNLCILRGRSLSSIETESDHQVLTMHDGEKISASLIIAADGAQSTVRDLVDFKIRSWEYGHKAIVTTVKTSESHQHTAWQNFLSSGPLAFLPLEHDSENYCSIVWSLENQRADELMSLDDSEFRKELANASEHRLGDIVWSDHRACFPLIQRHAIDYIKPQIALVGDAAHTIHPLAGQGVNLGLLDVYALANEISRASARSLSLSDESILRQYQRQRKRHNLEMMVLMESFKRLFGSRSLALRLLRNTGMKTLNKFPPIKNWLAKQAMGL
jgi:2-octaprenylphenol hydroxylase